MELSLHGDSFVHYRRQIRIKAIQALYQYQTDTPTREEIESWCQFAWEAGNDPDPAYSEALDPHLLDLMNQLMDQLETIDQQIEKYLHDWKLSRLAHIDLTVLRLAFYEILIADDEMVPPVAAVDEAIELAKGFSGDRSRKFVSGVLGQLLKSLDASEE